MNPDIQAQLQSRIEAFAADITSILQSAVAESVAHALGSTPTAGHKRGKQASRAVAGSSRKKGEKRAPEAIAALQAQLLREIKREGGRRIEQIALSMGTTTHELKVPMQHLLTDKSVRAKGQARATRYTAR